MKIKVEEYPEVINLDNVLYEIWDDKFLEVHFIFGELQRKWKFTSEGRYQQVKSNIQSISTVVSV